MNKYKVTIIKNDISESTIYQSDDNYSAVRAMVWEHFCNDESFFVGDLMARQPDFVRVTDITGIAQPAAGAHIGF